MKFNFPAAIFAHTNTAGQQVDHIFSEVEEVEQELMGRSGATDLDAVHRELADLHHSLETFWRILERDISPEYVVEIFRVVQKKNEKRGYYSIIDVLEFEEGQG